MKDSMLCIRLEKEDKILRMYKKEQYVVILTFFMPTENWWNELWMKFNETGIAAHGYDIGMCIIFINGYSMNEVYNIIKDQNWWQDGKTMDKV